MNNDLYLMEIILLGMILIYSDNFSFSIGDINYIINYINNNIIIYQIKHYIIKFSLHHSIQFHRPFLFLVKN